MNNIFNSLSSSPEQVSSNPEQVSSPQFQFDPSTFIESLDLVLDSFNPFPYAQEENKTPQFSAIAPETVFSSTTSSTSDVTNSVSALGKRNFHAMNNQTQMDPALLHEDKLHADKRRKISCEPSSVQEITNSPLGILMHSIDTELVRDHLMLEECKKRNPHIIQSFLEWYIRFEAFSKQMSVYFEEYKQNPTNSNFDINTLEVDYLDLLCEKFTIPDLFKVYALYYQDILQEDIQLFSVIFFNQNVIDNEWKIKSDEIKTKILEIENEYAIYQKNLKDFESEKSIFAIREDFFEKIEPLIIKLSAAENAIYEIKKELSLKAEELSKIVLEEAEIFEKNVVTVPPDVTASTVQSNLIVPPLEGNISQFNRTTDLWTPEYEEVFFKEVVPLFIKGGEQKNNPVWKRVAQMMNWRFKIPFFTATICWFKWDKVGKSRSISHSIWTKDRLSFFLKLASPFLNRKVVEKESWIPIAQKMNTQFNTTTFTWENCKERWQYSKPRTRPTLGQQSVHNLLV